METSFDLSAVTNGKRYCYCNCVQDTHTQTHRAVFERMFTDTVHSQEPLKSNLSHHTGVSKLNNEFLKSGLNCCKKN